MKTYTMKMTWLTIATAIIIIINLCFAELSLRGAINGLALCGKVIIPSLFPFCVIALFCYKSGVVNWVSKIISPITKRLLHINGEQFCVLLISLLAGYPIGMRLIKELADKKRITEKQAKNMGLYCINAGPAFIIVAVGNGILGDTLLGLYLFIANLTATIIILLITERRSIPSDIEENLKRVKLSDAFVESTAEASTSVMGICGWVILFSAFLALLGNPLFPSVIAKGIASLCEVTTAIINLEGNIPVIAAIIGFGGLCVHCQFYSLGKQYAPKYIKFLLFRILHAAISAGITYIILKFDNRTVETITNNVTIIRDNSTFSYASSAALIFMCCVFLCSVSKGKEKIM